MANDPLKSVLSRVAQGDRDAFAQLYRALEGPLYKFIHLRLNDPQRSADIVHDVFLQVWREAGSFRGLSKVSTWVFSMANRKVIDVYRRDKRLVFGDEVPEGIDDGPDGEACVLASERAEAVRECLQTLSPNHRAVIGLTFGEDMNYAEVAEIVGIPEGTVKSRVFHAKQLMLRCLSSRLGSKRHE